MVIWRVCSGFSILILYTVISRSEVMGETDKYRDINKRIFCNMAGCGNMVQGKRDYVKSRLYNMFNRPVGKRSHATIMENPTGNGDDDVTGSDLAQPYSNWSPENYESFEANLPYSNYEDNNVNSLPSEDNLLYSNQLGFEKPSYTLNEKYQFLKAAEDLLSYVNTLSRGKLNRRRPNGQQTRNFNSDWTGKRK